MTEERSNRRLIRIGQVIGAAIVVIGSSLGLWKYNNEGAEAPSVTVVNEQKDAIDHSQFATKDYVDNSVQSSKDYTDERINGVLNEYHGEMK